MLASMTGFGRASASVGDISYSLEIKSLNSKYFKASIKLPEMVSSYEPRIEQIMRKKLIRGSVVYTLRMKDISEQASWEVNLGAIRGYLQALEQVVGQAKPKIPIQVDLASILLLPGVCQLPESDPTEDQRRWEIVEQLTGQAIDQMLAMRLEEGKALQDDLDTHCRRIAETLDRIREKAPQIIHDYTARLRLRVETLLSEVEVQLREEDLAREVAIFAERADINEELARLGSHLKQFDCVMRNEGNTGRKLEFLAQEMLRETNTIGSKANDSAIAQLVVEIKGHIDRIKEQVMNVV